MPSFFFGAAERAWSQAAMELDLFSPPVEFADGGPRRIRVWTRAEHGAGPALMSIAQHPATGFIYVGTGRGVSEYDGVRWRNIESPNRAQTTGAMIDSVGRILVGGYDGVFLLQPDSAGELFLEPQAELLPVGFRRTGYVGQITNTPAGICLTSRRQVVATVPGGAVQVWRSPEAFGSVWWMDGALHASILSQGSFRLDATGEMTKLHTGAPVVFAARAEEKDDPLLLTARGPLVWRGKTGQFEVPRGYAEFFHEKQEMTAATFLRDGRSVFVSEGGDLGVFDREGRAVLIWRKVPTVAQDRVRQLAEDDEGGLWLAKQAGLIRIQLDDRPAIALHVIVRRVTDHRGRVRYSASGGAKLPAVLIPAHDDDTLRVEFAAPSYRHERQNGEKITFRSRLVERDMAWTDWTEEGVRELTGLPFKTLTLDIQAKRPDGVTSAVTSLVIRPVRSWWRTPWAWVLFGLSGVALWFGLHQWRTRALRQRTGRLEDLVAERTAELAEKNILLAAQNRELAALRQLDRDEKTAALVAEEKLRLEMLRYQLNPHFLYNTLNSLYSLVLTAPPAAADMVLRLADFCRAALEAPEDKPTTVGMCFDQLVRYLEIEKIRWGSSLQVEVAVEPEARDACLPPFLVLPLVENAIKHGGATSPDQLLVRLSARLVATPNGRDRLLEVEVANTGHWVDPATALAQGSTGIGLENVRQRLQRYYPGGHAVFTDTDNGWVRITLRIEKWATALVALPESPPSKPSSSF